MATSHVSALILAKSKSNRLPNKNTLEFNGEPMFLTNVRKCLSLFDSVYVSSDSHEILARAESIGAIPVLRGEELCGNCPNIPVYRHAFEHMKDTDAVVAVQANSPTVPLNIIEDVKGLLQKGYREVMTCHEDYSIYGSVWGLSKERLEEYQDFYHPMPDVLIVDNSVDIHILEDYNRAKEQL